MKNEQLEKLGKVCELLLEIEDDQVENGLNLEDIDSLDLRAFIAHELIDSMRKRFLHARESVK